MKRWKYSVFVMLMIVIGYMAVKHQPLNIATAKEKESTKGYVFESNDTMIIYDPHIIITDQKEQERLKKVVHIKFQGERLFFGNLTECLNLEKLTISKDTTSITVGHYSNDNDFMNLKEIVVDAANPVYASYKGALYTKDYRKLVYYPLKGSTEPVLSPQTRIIDSEACKGVPITSVQLPENLVIIEDGAFANTKLEEVTLPASVRIIDQSAFDDTPLKKVNIAEDNESLCSIDGVVYSKDHSYLYYWPSEKITERLVLPEGLTFLDCSKIAHFKKIQFLSIPKSLTAIVNTSNNQLQQVTLHKENSCFSLYDGVLYSKDQHILRLYPNQNTDHVIELSSKMAELPVDLFVQENTTTSLTLPGGLKKLTSAYGPGYNYKVMLGGFVHLAELKLSGESSNFVVQDNILYNKDKTCLLWYPIDLAAKEFIIPDTVTNIANDQLIRQNHLEKVTIPAKCMVYDVDSLTSEYQEWYEMPFGRECPKLTAFSVSEQNPYYTSIGGVLFSKDQKIMYGYPSAKQDTVYEIPETVAHAPFGNSNPYLQTLIVSKNVSTIGIDVYYTSGSYSSNGLLGFTALREIKVSDANPHLTSIDSVVYKKGNDYLDLQVYPRGKTDTAFYLPKETAVISGTEYFEHHSSLKKFYVDSTSKMNQIKDGKLSLNYQDYPEVNLDGIELLSK